LNRTIERGDKEGLEVVRDICIRGIGHFSNEATTLASLSKLVRQNGKADTTTRRLVTQKT